MRRAPQDVQVIHKNLVENYEMQFGEKPDIALLRSVVDMYMDNLRRDFIMNRIDGLTPIESKLLIALLGAEKQQAIKQEVKALEEAFDKAIDDKKVSPGKGKRK